MTTRRALGRFLPLLAVALVAGCAYFNALYNARRLYGDAEDATNRGDVAAAQAAHRESLEKAARSLSQDPAGRWADDALLLVGQNHFALGDCRAASAALDRLIRESRDPAVLARARAYRGATAICLDDAEGALGWFEQALPDLERDSPVHAFALLWRARARFETGAADSAWADLTRAARRDDALGRAASLEMISRALTFDRREHALGAFHALLADPDGDLHADSIRALARAASDRWGGRFAREALEPAPLAPWAGDLRDLLVVERARQAALAGDTALAIRELEQASARSADRAAIAARVVNAEIMLATATDAAELATIRAVLLPAIADPGARPLLTAIGIVGALLGHAQQGQPLALFAAAEIARDQLHARALARRLFAGYADVAGGGAWATKAVLAALALEPSQAETRALQARLDGATDVYALASRGDSAAGYEDAEKRLDQVLQGLIARATTEAQDRNVTIGAAIAQIDSLTAAVRADSLSLACGSFADSLGLAGVRRDSVSAACLRADIALVDSFLVVDTIVWLPEAVGDEAGRRNGARPNERRQ
ncbi:MAG TPA: hypothetical protein VF039_06755 [Longimicrobiales bacterium]